MSVGVMPYRKHPENRIRVLEAQLRHIVKVHSVNRSHRLKREENRLEGSDDVDKRRVPFLVPRIDLVVQTVVDLDCLLAEPLYRRQMIHDVANVVVHLRSLDVQKPDVRQLLHHRLHHPHRVLQLVIDPIHLAEDEVEVVHVREGVGLQPIKAEVAAAAVAQHERVFDLVQFPQDTKSHVRNAVHMQIKQIKQNRHVQVVSRVEATDRRHHRHHVDRQRHLFLQRLRLARFLHVVPERDDDVPLREEKHVEKRPLQRVSARRRLVKRQPRKRDVDVGGSLACVHANGLGSDVQNRVQIQTHHRSQRLDEVIGDAFKVKELETGGKGRVGREERLTQRLEQRAVVGRRVESNRVGCVVGQVVAENVAG